jgi:hypothetical protein
MYFFVPLTAFCGPANFFIVVRIATRLGMDGVWKDASQQAPNGGILSPGIIS